MPRLMPDLPHQDDLVTASKLRRWLRLGPSRQELIADARLWRERRHRSDEENRETHQLRKEWRRRARVAEDLIIGLRVRLEKAESAEQRAADAQARLQEVLNYAHREPPPGQDCTKVRFHQRREATQWADTIASRFGEPREVYHTYACRRCPRSPVTMQRYWHVGHVETKQAQLAKERATRERKERSAADGPEGFALEELVDPEDLARLRQLNSRQ